MKVNFGVKTTGCFAQDARGRKSVSAGEDKRVMLACLLACLLAPHLVRRKQGYFPDNKKSYLLST
jgi:ABC-type hemin transport system ATPase subunit